MYNIKVKYLNYINGLKFTEEENLHSIIDCLTFINEIKNIDNFKILNVCIDYIKE